MISLNLKLWSWLVLALIFLLGVATGVSLTIGLSPHFTHLPGARQMKEQMLKDLTHRLNLTPDQQAKVQPILADVATQMQTVHRDEVGRISQIMEKANSQIAAILTPEQQTELQTMQKEMESKRDWMAPGHMHSRKQLGMSPSDEAPNPPPVNAPSPTPGH